MGGIIPISSKGKRERVLRRDVLCVDLDETTREVSRILCTWRFHDDEVVYLAAWDDVERECP